MRLGGVFGNSSAAFDVLLAQGHQGLGFESQGLCVVPVSKNRAIEETKFLARFSKEELERPYI